MERGCRAAARAAAAAEPRRRRLPSYCLMMVIGFGAARLAVADELQYCPFFNNRGTSPQNLYNCTWYANSSCCRQVEIDYTFSKVTPPQGASKACLDQLNYLMCYICDPRQYTFYRIEYLTVCEEFCDNLYGACRDSVLKGSVIGDLYRSGKQFCQSRRFEVRSKQEGNCFYYDGSGRTSGARRSVGSPPPPLRTAAAAALLSALSLCAQNRLAAGAS